MFAWGLGDNFVLANGKEMDGNEYVPRKVNPKFFKEERPVLFALGSQHVMFTLQEKEFRIYLDSL